MMDPYSFRACLAADLSNVFLNPQEFAQRHTVRYDGTEYVDIPVSIQELEELDRLRTSAHGVGTSRPDGGQSLYQISAILYCSKADLGGQMPEQGKTISVSNEEDGRWFDQYRIVSAGHEMGLLRLELKAVTE